MDYLVENYKGVFIEGNATINSIQIARIFFKSAAVKCMVYLRQLVLRGKTR